jgi:hypothetical protein
MKKVTVLHRGKKNKGDGRNTLGLLPPAPSTPVLTHALQADILERTGRLRPIREVEEFFEKQLEEYQRQYEAYIAKIEGIGR